MPSEKKNMILCSVLFKPSCTCFKVSVEAWGWGPQAGKGPSKLWFWRMRKTQSSLQVTLRASWQLLRCVGVIIQSDSGIAIIFPRNLT